MATPVQLATDMQELYKLMQQQQAEIAAMGAKVETFERTRQVAVAAMRTEYQPAMAGLRTQSEEVARLATDSSKERPLLGEIASGELGTQESNPIVVCNELRASNNLQIVSYHGSKRSALPVEPSRLFGLPHYIAESLKGINVMVFGAGATSSCLMTSALTSGLSLTASLPILLVSSLLGGVALSVFRYRMENVHTTPVALDSPIFAHKPITITTKEEALSYLDLPLDKIDDKTCIERRVALLLKRCEFYLNLSTSSASKHPLHTLITTIVENIKISQNLLK